MLATLTSGFTGTITIILLIATLLCLVFSFVLKGNARAKVRSFMPYVIGAFLGWVVVQIVLYFIW